jgi:acetyl esterase/lipase
MIENSIQFKFKDVVGSVYHNEGNKTGVIFCAGGPFMGDNGMNPLFSEIAKELGISIIVPDYLGSGRSGKEIFDIKNSVETIAQCEEFLFDRKSFKNCWENRDETLSFEEIILVGHSWGGTMCSLYFKFFPQSKIQKAVFLAGALDYDEFVTQEYGGETDEEFWQQIQNGWTYYYRNILNSDWKDLVLGTSKENNPLHNTTYLKGRKIFLIHGSKDNIISSDRSKIFYEKYVKQNGEENISFKVEPLDHHTILGKETFVKIKDFD